MDNKKKELFCKGIKAALEAKLYTTKDYLIQVEEKTEEEAEQEIAAAHQE